MKTKLNKILSLVLVIMMVVTIIPINSNTIYAYEFIDNTSKFKDMVIEQNNNTRFIIKEDGTLWAIGANSNGQLGTGDTTTLAIWAKVLENVKEVYTNTTSTFAIKNDGTLWVVGNNTSIGVGLSTGNTLVWTQILDNVKTVNGVGSTTVVTKNDGTIWATGSNTYGQLGNGTTTVRYTFNQVASDVKEVILSGETLMFLKNDNTLWGCGRNYSGQFGTGNTNNVLNPIQIIDDVNYAIYSNNSTYVLKNTKELWVAGSNSSGKLGIGTAATTNLTFVKVADTVDKIYVSSYNAFILKSNELLGTGKNSSGELGLSSSTTQVTSFTSIATDVKDVFNNGGSSSTFILKIDNSLWVSGYNTSGQLGTGTKANVYGFIKVLDNVKEVYYNNTAVAVITIDNSLYVAGETAKRLGTTENYTTFTKVLDNVSKVIWGYSKHNTFIINTDGKLLASGLNDYGMIRSDFPTNAVTIEFEDIENRVKTEYLISIGTTAYAKIDKANKTITVKGTSYTTSYTLTTAPFVAISNDIESVVIEEGVASLGEYLFSGLQNLKTVTFPTSLKNISRFAFNNCTSLSIVDTNAVEKISCGAFYNVPLTEIYFGKDLITIEDSSFKGVTKYTRVIVKDRIATNPLAFGQNNNPFEYVPPIVEFEDGLDFFNVTPTGTISRSKIGGYFKGLVDLIIPETLDGVTVNSIGATGFTVMPDMGSVILPSSIRSIGDKAFENSGITNIILNEGLLTIGNYVFNGTDITTLAIPYTVTNVGAIGTALSLEKLYNYREAAQVVPTGTGRILPTGLSNFISAYGYPTNTTFKTKIESDGYFWQDINSAPPLEKTLISIKIDDSKPFNNNFELNQILGTNIYIKANYSDTSTGSIQVTSDIITGFDTSTVGTKTVTVNYGGKITTFTINVIDSVSTIELQTGDYKTQYIVGDLINVTNMQLLVTHASGFSELVDVTADMITGFDTANIGNKVLNIAYGGRFDSCLINVKENSITGIGLTGTSYKTDYIIDDTLDLTNMNIAVAYANGTITNIPVTADMLSGFSTTTAGTKTVTVTYITKTTSYDINVAKPTNIIEAELAVQNAEASETQADYDIAKQKVDVLGLSQDKNDLQYRLQILEVEIALNTAEVTITRFELTETTEDYNDAMNKLALALTLLNNCPAESEILIVQNEILIEGTEVLLASNEINITSMMIPLGTISLKDALISRFGSLDARLKVKQAEVTQAPADIQAANDAVAVLPVGTEKDTFTNRVDVVEQTVADEQAQQVIQDNINIADTKAGETQGLINTVGTTPTTEGVSITQGKIDEIQAVIDTLPVGTEKDRLQGIVNDLQTQLDVIKNNLNQQETISNIETKIGTITDITESNITETQNLITEIQNLINTLPSGTEKDSLQQTVTNLQNQLDTVQSAIEEQAIVDNIESKLQDITNLGTINEGNVGNVQTLITEAQNLINTLPTGTEKDRLQGLVNNLQNEVDNILENLSEQSKINIIEGKLQLVVDSLTNVTEANAPSIQTSINEIQSLMGALSTGTEKDRLQGELTTLQNELNTKVRDIELAKGIEIEQGTQTLVIGAKVQLTQTSSLPVTWTSSDDSIVTVSSTGRITAIAPGQVTIASTITGTELSNSVVVKVSAEIINVSGLEITETTLELNTRSSSTLNYVVNPVDASDKRVTWASSNNAIASVVNGTITAISKGTALITGTTVNGGYADGVTVNVLEVVEDNTTPVVITVTPRTLEPSKTVTVDISVEGSMLEIILPNGARAFGNPLSYTLRENGAFTFGVMGKDKVSTDSKTIEINNIDTIAPIITFVTSGSAISTVTVNAIDDGEIDKAYNPSGQLINLPYEFDARSMTGTFVVVDKAGNRASKDYQLSTVLIGTTAEPTFIALDGIPKEWTNKAVTITVGAQNEIDGITDIIVQEKSIVSKKVSLYSFAAMRSNTFASINNMVEILDNPVVLGGASSILLKDINITSNGEIEYTIITGLGSYTDTAVIDKIDMVNPTLDVEVNGDTVTFTAGDNASGIKSIMLPTGEVIAGESAGDISNIIRTFVMLGNGEFEITVEDHAGNTFTKTFTMTSENPNDEKLPEEPGETGGNDGGGSSGGNTEPEETVKPETPIVTEKEVNVSIKDNITIKKINGYINGYENNTFIPNGYITRAEVSQIMSNIIEGKGDITRELYDIEGKWYTSSVKRVVTLGIMQGFEDNTFKPENYITRQDFAITLTNLLDVEESYGKTKVELKDIADKYGKTSIELLASMDVISGYEDDTFKPDNNITRAEAVKMINKLLDEYVEKDNDKKSDLTDIYSSWAVNEIIRAYIVK